MNLGMVVWVVLMILWLLGGSYLAYDTVRPYAIGGTLLPWGCVAILGYYMFRGSPPPRV